MMTRRLLFAAAGLVAGRLAGCGKTSTGQRRDLPVHTRWTWERIGRTIVIGPKPHPGWVLGGYTETGTPVWVPPS